MSNPRRLPYNAIGKAFSKSDKEARLQFALALQSEGDRFFDWWYYRCRQMPDLNDVPLLIQEAATKFLGFEPDTTEPPKSRSP